MNDNTQLIMQILARVKPRAIVRQVIEVAYLAGYEAKSDGITLMPQLAFKSLKLKHPAGVGHDWLYYAGLKKNPFLPHWVETEASARAWCDEWFKWALIDFGHPWRARVWWFGLRIGGWVAWDQHRRERKQES